VRPVKGSSRWEARCTIGGKKTSLGTFDSEEEAARAWDRFKLCSCKGDRKKKEEVEKLLNFSLSKYSDDELSELQGMTQAEVLTKLRRAGQEERAANQKSKYTGVKLKKSGRWEAQCWIGGTRTFLGTFASEEDAARACDRYTFWSCKANG
jgi:hypothetical protein